MKVVILAGGFGTRISEESHLIPKPMIRIDDKPILWHIMKYFSVYGFNEFIILAGYKQNVIKEYFDNYHINNNDVKFDLKTGTKVVESKKNNEEWVVTIVDSGINTMTGGRLLSLLNLFEDKDFLLTYGDGVSDVDLNKLIEFHNLNSALVTITAVKPGGRFGSLNIDKNQQITDFREKNPEDMSWINGGFMVVNRDILKLIQNRNEVLEKDTLNKVISLRGLYAFKHYGYWQCMDTIRDRELLEMAIKEKNAPWMIW